MIVRPAAASVDDAFELAPGIACPSLLNTRVPRHVRGIDEAGAREGERWEGKGVRAPVIEGYSYRKGLPA